MVLKGKMVTELGIRSPAVKFFNVFAKQLHNLQDIVDKVYDGKLHEGDWHDTGSVKSWNLTTGKVRTFKESIEAIDEQSKSISFKIFDGENSKDYKMYKVHLQVIDIEEEGGVVTIWTIEYEKLNEDVAPPYHYLDIITATTKETDAHVLKAEQ
ncbi:hypothetical protein AAZX31_10G080400 [Glycine max]|uniref:Bet v I/Major latex protein domain-containing protein n=2 Tax=Glycine subgen. Soja TaxID=1462606 RepID=K7LI42_SOYBN|nr:MLP-like protein 43 [Glycine max]XP_028182778.1 MLP-like protein 43 [Glycine soja]KAG4982494.1 hypothetical protein JHK87_027243 [Glycine soja]KAG4996546.1 hypothetical protein JHK85_027985 [Glycine max]KAG5126506.1 hypothetical protein JHK82_027341 [Glycine max]KAG5151110.1 hypothetical protein JHK84_027582 [Glycine max]KAH1137360.1 hypothetical protein GYH30_027377 [Glycine max]|eukprot:XP_025979765.1 MLP-like protein 43 [Glycine max]